MLVLTFPFFAQPVFIPIQRTDYTNLDAYTWYKGKKQHYNLFATFVLNDEQVREKRRCTK